MEGEEIKERERQKRKRERKKEKKKENVRGRGRKGKEEEGKKEIGESIRVYKRIYGGQRSHAPKMPKVALFA